MSEATRRLRPLLVLALLIPAMLGLMALHGDAAGRADPLTLASIGFVVLASFMAADVGAALTLPRVTGYILVGALLGPHVANVLSNNVVSDIKMFNTLALGLIAISAGLELDLAGLKSVIRTLLFTTLLKVVLGLAVVGGLLYAIEINFGVLSGGDAGKAAALALVFGVLSIGTSPSIVLAVMTETRAKGRMSELMLGAAVLKDLVVVVCLAIAIAVGGSRLTASAEHDIVKTLAIELGVSVAAGTCLGVIYILYIRFIKAEMLLFVAATILLVAELSAAFHLELLLMFIAAGFVVRNFSKLAHDLLHPVEMVALPVFVVFFTTAGAAIDLPQTLKLLPVAGALVVARALVYFVAARLGSRWGGEDEQIQRRAWLGYLPQAGVTLGLVGVAAAQLGAIEQEIQRLGTAIVALNLLVGPVTLRRVLVSSASTSHPSAAPTRVSLPPSRALPEELTRELQEVQQRVEELGEQVLTALCQKIETALRSRFCPALRDGEYSLDSVNASFDDQLWPSAADVSASARAFLSDAQFALRQVPETLRVPLLRADLRAEEHDSWPVRVALVLRRILMWFSPRLRYRVVPLRLFVRTEMEPRLARASRELTVAHAELLLVLMSEFRAAAIGTRSCEEAERRADQALSRFRERFSVKLQDAMKRTVRQLHPRLLHYDGPRRRIPFPSSKAAERTWSSLLGKLLSEAPEWERILSAELGLLRVEVTLWGTRRRVRDHLVQLTDELGPIWARYWRDLDAWRKWLEKLIQPGTLDEREPLLAELESLARSEGVSGVGQIVIRTSRELHELALDFRAVSQKLPESLVVYRASGPLDQVASPDDLQRHLVFPKQEFLDSLVEQLIPDIEVSVEDVSVRSDRVARTLSEGQSLMLDSLSDAERGAGLTLAVAQAELIRVEELLDELDSLQVRWEESLIDLSQRGFEQLSDSLTRSTTAALIARQRSRLLRALIRWREGLKELLLRALRWVTLPLLGALRQANHALRLPAGLRSGEPRQARDCAREVERWLAPFSGLTAGYAKLFSSEPLREPKLLVARDEQIAAILEVEQDRDGGSSVLIDGEPGAGRTSLLNVVQLQLTAHRVLRLEHPRSERISWRVVLADTLGCASRVSIIRRELEREVTTVLLDDLEDWISPRPGQLRQDLDELVSLVVATRRTTCWLVTVSSDAHRLYREISGIDRAFYKTIELTPMSAPELAELAERRHRRSGLKLVYDPTFVTRWVGRLKGADARSMFFRYLARAAEGNPSRALLTWVNQLQVEQSLARESVHLKWSLGLSFITRFGALEVAILIQLSRFRRLTFDELLDTTRAGRLELARTLAFLEMARLVMSERWKTTWYTVDPRLRPLIHHALPKGLMRG